VSLDLTVWPDREAIECAVLFPATFVAKRLEHRGSVDSMFEDLAERCARARNTQDLLETMERELGAQHDFYLTVCGVFWDAMDRQAAPMGSQRGMNDPRDDAFLQSVEWRRVRMLVLERDGARCACCGRTASDGLVINVDHIKPRKRYPQLALDPKNLQVLCDECNHGKGNRFQTDWRSSARA